LPARRFDAAANINTVKPQVSSPCELCQDLCLRHKKNTLCSYYDDIPVKEMPVPPLAFGSNASSKIPSVKYVSASLIDEASFTTDSLHRLIKLNAASGVAELGRFIS